MVGFHFPPLVGTSGVQRMLRFAQHLPEFGWTPHVLTADERAYPQADRSTLSEIPAGVEVTRAFALDAARHLSVGGRYFRAAAIPDRWSTWIPFATWAAVRLIDRMRVDAVWSTYPLASAHAIGARVHRLRGKPWIADFRDPMAQEGYPEDPRLWRSFSKIERRAAERARFLTFTSPGARALYADRYVDIAPPARFVILPNGYDEGSFVAGHAEPDRERDSRISSSVRQTGFRPLVLLHSGVVYPSERDPTLLFAALAALRGRGALDAKRLRLRFRASSHDDLIRSLAAKYGIPDMIDLAPAIPYREALAEMRAADGLLILQAANCNGQIPAKLYEYLRAGRPILGMTDPAGDTGQLLASLKSPYLAALEDQNAIENVLGTFVSDLGARTAYVVPDNEVARFSRRNLARDLAALLDQATAPVTAADATH
ncbi:glycosyltransferase family 4 protein [Zeimonas arvi]|uniref:Glycosyltransferase family 4 protein n=2 Tax=Zeimonas arvi TaxID=2498847 RepID=A0A5C8NZJ1_9BURK|nr:glycosyltransferase family 4 protein [Zeimonas arvi]